MRTPSYEEYRAAGHDHATAEALVGVDGICAMHRQVNVMRHALKHGNARPRGAGRPKARTSSARRSSERSGDSGDPDEEPVRLCANARCRADISHLHVLAEYCDNGGACKQAAYRDRQVLDYLRRCRRHYDDGDLVPVRTARPARRRRGLLPLWAAKGGRHAGMGTADTAPPHDREVSPDGE